MHYHLPTVRADSVDDAGALFGLTLKADLYSIFF
jgi:hypothetical protein